MSEAPRYASVLGLGFGDCGKGHFVDALCRRWKARTVVRFNGGAQAGHNVVLPDGRHHTFSQFGSGTFVEGTRTLLADPVVVHPTALLVEHRILSTAGPSDALGRLSIDERCRINTPLHQAAGRLRELERGSAAHGTCGVGFGETVRQSIERPELSLRYGDLADRRLVLEKLDALRSAYVDEFRPSNDRFRGDRSWEGESGLLSDPGIPARWLDAIVPLLAEVPPASPETVRRILSEPGGTILFEGAQGALLDEWRGFHPHTTWSSVHAGAIDELVAAHGLTGSVMHLGAMRSYPTRHGRGPFPTFDPELDILAEPHNDASGWQGEFRRGHPDAVLLRYALDAVGPLSGLLVGHLDVFDRLPEGLRWCEAYMDPTTHGTIDRLPFSPARDLSRQQSLGDLLGRSRPVYREARLRSPEAFPERMADLSGLPIRFRSHGNTHLQIREGSRR